MSKKPCLVLLNPPLPIKCQDLESGDKLIAESMGLGYLASYLRKHSETEVIIIDAYLEDLSTNQTIKRILKHHPFMVGISISYKLALEYLKPLLSQLKKKLNNCKIVAGGNYATFNHVHLLNAYPELDTVVCGEGEITLLELVRRYRNSRTISNIPGIAFRNNGRIKNNNPRRRKSDLDIFPFPARDTLPLVLRRRGSAYIATSRGCYGRCKFCAIRAFFNRRYGPSWRGRSPENVAREFQHLRDKFNVDRVFVVDDNFMGPGKRGVERAFRIADALRSINNQIAFSIQMRSDQVNEELLSTLIEVGLRGIYIGLESGYQPTLDYFRKDNTIRQNLKAVSIIKKLDLAAFYSLIMFNPKSNWDEFNANLNFLRKVEDFNLQWAYGLLRNYQGAEFEKELKNIPAHNIPAHIGCAQFSLYDILHPQLKELASILLECMAPARIVFYLWEKVKWDIYMNYHIDRGKIQQFKELNKSLQREGIDLIEQISTKVKNRGSLNKRIIEKKYKKLFKDYENKWSRPLLELNLD